MPRFFYYSYFEFFSQSDTTNVKNYKHVLCLYLYLYVCGVKNRRFCIPNEQSDYEPINGINRKKLNGREKKLNIIIKK
jgi:hypothetical protein